MNRLTDEQIEKAVNWWSEKIQAPSFSALSSAERQMENNRPVAMAEMQAQSLVKDISSKSIDRFKAVLKRNLNQSNGRVSLSVDYHPSKMLSESAKEAGIPLTNFPWKTSMQFHDDGSTTVRCGYGAESVTI